MICSKCGQPLELGATFCGNCGQPIQQAPTPQPQAQVVVSQPPSIVQPSVPPAPQTIAPQPQAQVIQPASAAPLQPVQQSTAVMQQVLANQPTAPVAPINFNNPSFATPSGRAIPAYAEAPIVSKGAEIRSVIGLIIGVVGIPGSIIPIVGLALGIAGLVLSTTARSKYKHLINLLAIIFSSVAIVVALGVWAYNVQRDTKAADNNSVSSADLRAINTPCYDVKLPTGLNSYTAQGCNINSTSYSQAFQVSVVENAEITSSNFATVGQSLLTQVATQINATLTSQYAGEFAGSPAAIGIYNLGNDQYQILAAVLHPEASDNIFIVGRAVRSTTNTQPTFESLESTWTWK